MDTVAVVTLRDGEIRAVLTAQLRRQHAAEADTLIRNELGLCVGATRVDIAVVNGTIAGYEIKSDRDTLNRLPGQVELYNRVLDTAWLVTTSRYSDRVMSLISPWWGLLTVEGNASDNLILELVRDAAPNEEQDALSIAQLLWRDEALDELRARHAHRGLSRSTRWAVWERLVEYLPLAELKAIVRSRLKARPSWPGGQ